MTVLFRPVLVILGLVPRIALRLWGLAWAVLKPRRPDWRDTPWFEPEARDFLSGRRAALAFDRPRLTTASKRGVPSSFTVARREFD